MQTKVDIIRGKESLLKDALLQILPRVGEVIHVHSTEQWGRWSGKVVKVEHSFLKDPPTHTIHVFLGRA
jgi:hypothetical protein